MTTHHLTVAVSPSKQNPTREAVTPAQLTADLADAWRRFDPDVLVATEVQRRRYRTPFRRSARAHGAAAYAVGEDTPVASRLPVKRSAVRVLHAGLAKATPARKNVIVRLRDMPVLEIAKHATATGPRLPKLAARLRFWRTDAEKTAARIKRANAAGRTVIVLGDLNVDHAPGYAVNEILVARAGVIGIYAYPAPGHQIQVGHIPAIPAHQRHADHAAIGARLTITTAKETR